MSTIPIAVITSSWPFWLHIQSTTLVVKDRLSVVVSECNLHIQQFVAAALNHSNLWHQTDELTEDFTFIVLSWVLQASFGQHFFDTLEVAAAWSKGILKFVRCTRCTNLRRITTNVLIGAVKGFRVSHQRWRVDAHLGLLHPVTKVIFEKQKFSQNFSMSISQNFTANRRRWESK